MHESSQSMLPIAIQGARIKPINAAHSNTGCTNQANQCCPSQATVSVIMYWDQNPTRSANHASRAPHASCLMPARNVLRTRQGVLPARWHAKAARKTTGFRILKHNSPLYKGRTTGYGTMTHTFTCIMPPTCFVWG